MAENQAKHRQDLESASLRTFSTYHMQSLWLSALVTVSCVVGGYLLLQVSQIAGAALMVGGIGTQALGLFWKKGKAHGADS